MNSMQTWWNSYICQFTYFNPLVCLGKTPPSLIPCMTCISPNVWVLSSKLHFIALPLNLHCSELLLACSFSHKSSGFFLPKIYCHPAPQSLACSFSHKSSRFFLPKIYCHPAPQSPACSFSHKSSRLLSPKKLVSPCSPKFGVFFLPKVMYILLTVL